MKIIEFQGGQGSQSWLQWRRSKITATDAGIILGLNNFKNMHQLWQEKMGFIDPEPENESMKRGQLLEPIARAQLSAQLGINFQPVVIESDDYPWMGASLDGIEQEKCCICEIKCMKLHKHLKVSRETLDPCHYAQMQHQLACSGYDSCIYQSWHDNETIEQSIYFKVFRDDEYIKNMIEKEKQFFFETMCCMKPTSDSWVFKEKVR